MVFREFYSKYFLELIKEVELQTRNILTNHNDTYNWIWFATCILAVVLIYTFKLSSINRVFKRSYIFIKQKRAQTEFVKDLKFFALKIFYKPFVIALFAFDVHSLSKLISKSLNVANIHIPVFLHLDPHLGPVFKLIITMMAYDFGYYVVHYLQHNYTPFWLFHKVHHRATSINPLTKIRIHPFEYFFNYTIQATIATPIVFFATSFYVIPNDKPLYVYMLVALLISRALAHLRHSHVRIHFGILSYIFISPVMHQVHHSMLDKHYNKNLATLFSFWDLMFGTFYLPKKNEFFKFGVKDYKNQIPTLREELILPFKELYQYLSETKPFNKKLRPVYKSKSLEVLKIKGGIE